ncbi:MAG: isoamylase early set domain-containing protein [bacterium]|nr:isoamylase early set domain-containing protein [bacterium]
MAVKKNGRKKPARRRVSFKLDAPKAQRVNLVGTFNHWDPKARTLRQDPKGTWKTNMLLEPGQYEFRFLVDGNWRNDPESKYVCNAFGSENCVRVVE